MKDIRSYDARIILIFTHILLKIETETMDIC